MTFGSPTLNLNIFAATDKSDSCHNHDVQYSPVGAGQFGELKGAEFATPYSPIKNERSGSLSSVKEDTDGKLE